MGFHELLEFLWIGNSIPGRLMTLVLLVLGGVAARAALKHRARYRHRERRTLEEVRAKLRRMLEAQQAEGEDEEEERARPMLPQPVELHELREHVPADTLIGDRLAALARMKQARVKVNVAALQQMTVLRESANTGLAFPGYAVDLAMMLGMLGTFIGLCLMLLQMQRVVPAAAGASDGTAFTQAAESLGNIIASKKTAFVTTLLGLLCAICISGLNFLLARAQSAFYDLLERFTVEELLPATVPQVEDETAMEKLSLQMSDTFSRLGTLTEEHTGNVERMEAMETAFGNIVENIRALALQAARAPADETSGALAQVVAHLSGVTTALDRLAARMYMPRTESVSVHAPAPRSGIMGLLERYPLAAVVVGGMAVWAYNVFFH